MMYATGAAILLIALIIFKKSGCFFKSFFTSALGGLGALCAVKAVSMFVPLTLGINVYSLVIGTLFSVPGVIMMLLVGVAV